MTYHVRFKVSLNDVKLSYNHCGASSPSNSMLVHGSRAERQLGKLCSTVAVAAVGRPPFPLK